MPDYAFDAFISYSHRDMKWGQWLQKKLETFRIPKDMMTEDRASKRFRIFRDQTDLAGVELKAALRKELETSRYLIVICSPNSASSSWVGDEIQAFHDMGKTDHIIPFIVEGEPESDDPELECYHPNLRNIDGHHMLGANVRELGKNKAFLKLVSILLDVRFNRLVDREKQRRRRSGLMIGSICAVTAAVVIGLVVHNAVISKRNHELAYDSYLSAMAHTFQEGDDFREAVKNVDIDDILTSAEEGNIDAVVMLTSCYYNGYGTQPDYEKALYWAEVGANSGDPDCMSILANFYENGIGVEQDLKKAYEWERKAAEAGKPSSMAMIALNYVYGTVVEKDPDQAFYWFTKAAEGGDEDGMIGLAVCYRDGIGCEADLGKAFELNLQAAEAGNTTGMFNVAVMYQAGMGVEENPELSYEWFRKGAEAGDPGCAYMVGWCTENRYGTKDPALEWYKRSEELAEKTGDTMTAEKAQEKIESLEG